MDQLVIEGNKYGFDKEGYINFLDFFGPFSLEYALKNGRFEFLQLLIEKGADLYLCNNNDWTPINIAIAKAHFDLTKFLIENGSYVNSYTKTPLLENECRYITPEIVNLLIKRKEFINFEDKKDGRAPIDMAMNTGNVEIVQILIQNGAELTGINFHKLVPWAIIWGHLEMLRFLIKIGANPNENYEGEGLLLTLAIEKERLEITKFLIDHGCEINYSTDNDWTPIHNAIDVENLELVQVLVKNGADLEILDEYGWKPLPFAVHSSPKIGLTPTLKNMSKLCSSIFLTLWRYQNLQL